MSPESLTPEIIFAQAIAIADASDRTAFLDRVCAHDSVLRSEIEKLVKDHFQAGDFLERPAGQIGITVNHPAIEQPGSLIGLYKLLEQIGEGGMGVVFMAEQQEPVRRKVALKVIKPGMDTRQVIARFEAERQALAVMDHPSIARVLDAGATESGRPYFVMELVRGVAITTYCDENNLPVRERLELFASVCQAIQHAHTKGIVHRDIKPTNVLVTRQDGRPVVKVIDFGVAKAMGQQLTEKTLFTNFAQMIGTPLYMSPEQAERSGVDIDTRSDIYSLGVLLYELLTGSTPVDEEQMKKAAFDEVRRIIREDEPQTPSARISGSNTLPAIAAHRHIEPARLSKLVRGELDWIVMKALEKDRSRRYETANGLAAEIQRYLADEPVLACPPSATYRFRKFARKNRKLLATITALGILLVVATIGAILAAVQSGRLAEKEQELRSAAEQRADAEAKARKELDQRLYVNRIALAQQELFAQNTGRAQELLDQCPVPLRGWEWHFLKRFRPGNPLTLAGPKHTNVVAFSPDGRHLATKNVHGTIDIVDAKTGRMVLNVPVGGMHGIAFSPTTDDAVLAMPGHFDLLVRIWDVKNGQEIRSLQGHTDRLRDVAFSPNGQRLASGGYDGFLKVWDWKTGQLLFGPKVARVGISRLAYSPDGQRIAAGVWGNAKEVVIVDAATGREIRTFGERSGGIEGVAYSPDGRCVATSASDGTVKIWNETTGVLLHTLLGHTGPVQHVVYTPDGRRLASAGWDKTVKIWDAETGQETLTLRGHTDVVSMAAFSRDGHFLASTGYDGTRIWNATPVNEIADAESFDVPGHTSAVKSVAFSPDGRHLASAGLDRLIKVWDVDSLGQATEPKGLTLRGHTDMVTGVAFSPDSRRLASCGWDGTVRVWDSADTHPLLSLAVGNTVESVAFSPDRQRLASLGPEKLVVWDATTGEKLAVGPIPSGAVPCVAYSPDGRNLALCSFNSVRIWDAATAKEVRSFGHNAIVWSVAYSPDGKRLASASFDRSIRIWDTTSWQEIRSLRGHTDRVMSVAFSPDGEHLASGSGDSTVKVWGASSGQELTTFRGHTGYVWSVAFSPDGKRLTSAGGHHNKGEVKVWDLASTLAAANQPEQVEKARRQAIEFYEMLAIAQPKALEHRRNLGHAYAQQDQWDKAAVEYVNAIELAPQDGYFRNTLGVAQYRAGNWKAAIEALEKSMELRDGGDAFDWFFLAMASWQLDHKDDARQWHGKAVEWMDKNQPENEELRRFRIEAAELLRVNEQKEK
ncbi:MAG: protein kinase [Pirellulales bacterium]